MNRKIEPAIGDRPKSEYKGDRSEGHSRERIWVLIQSGGAMKPHNALILPNHAAGQSSDKSLLPHFHAGKKKGCQKEGQERVDYERKGR